MMEEVQPGVYRLDKKIATRALVPGRVYGEQMRDGYRVWDPRRSKLAAMIRKGMKVPLDRDTRVLYLGAATGTTASHVSDITVDGIVYLVEFSPRAMRDLIRVAEERVNMIPLLADASQPGEYGVVGEVDLIYQDVAQRDQAGIAIENAHQYLKPGGCLVMAVKGPSIDSTAPPEEIINREISRLDAHFEVVERRSLEPYHVDHAAVVARFTI